MAIRTIIIDDSKVDLQHLKGLLAPYEDIHLLETFTDPAKAYAFLHQNKVDLVVTDIKMGEHNGLSLAESLPKETAFVLMSSFAEYALEGFELDALDYLQKPVNPSRFLKTYGKLQERLKAKTDTPSQMEIKEADSFFVKVDGQHTKIKISEVLYIKAEGDYSKVVTEKGKHLVLQSLRGFLEKLSGSFLRVHRGYVVNVDQVTSISKHELYCGDEQIPIGRTYSEVYDQIIASLPNFA